MKIKSPHEILAEDIKLENGKSVISASDMKKYEDLTLPYSNLVNDKELSKQPNKITRSFQRGFWKQLWSDVQNVGLSAVKGLIDTGQSISTYGQTELKFNRPNITDKVIKKLDNLNNDELNKFSDLLKKAKKLEISQEDFYNASSNIRNNIQNLYTREENKNVLRDVASGIGSSVPAIGISAATGGGAGAAMATNFLTETGNFINSREEQLRQENKTMLGRKMTAKEFAQATTIGGVSVILDKILDVPQQKLATKASDFVNKHFNLDESIETAIKKTKEFNVKKTNLTTAEMPKTLSLNGKDYSIKLDPNYTDVTSSIKSVKTPKTEKQKLSQFINRFEDKYVGHLIGSGFREALQELGVDLTTAGMDAWEFGKWDYSLNQAVRTSVASFLTGGLFGLGTYQKSKSQVELLVNEKLKEANNKLPISEQKTEQELNEISKDVTAQVITNTIYQVADEFGNEEALRQKFGNKKFDNFREQIRKFYKLQNNNKSDEQLNQEADQVAFMIAEVLYNLSTLTGQKISKYVDLNKIEVDEKGVMHLFGADYDAISNLAKLVSKTKKQRTEAETKEFIKQKVLKTQLLELSDKKINKIYNKVVQLQKKLKPEELKTNEEYNNNVKELEILKNENEELRKQINDLNNNFLTTTKNVSSGDYAIFGTNTIVPSEFVVIDAKDLQTSHNEEDMSINKNYAIPELQDRDRNGVLDNDIIQNISIMPKSSALVLTELNSITTSGMPTITNKGNLVIVGNARAMGIKRAYRTGKAENYRKQIEALGFDTTGMEQPIIVRKLKEDYNKEHLISLAELGNKTITQVKTDFEKMRTDAKQIDESLILLLNPNVTDIFADSNKEFVTEFFNRITNRVKGELGNLIDENGILTGDGMRRIRNALMAKLFGYETNIEKENLETIYEKSFIRGYKTLIDDIIDNSAVLLRLDVLSNKQGKDFGISKDLSEALIIFIQNKNDNVSIDEYLRQIRIEDKNPVFKALSLILSEVKPITKMVDGKQVKINPEKPFTLLDRYISLAKREVLTSEDLFNPVTKLDLLKKVINEDEVRKEYIKYIENNDTIDSLFKTEEPTNIKTDEQIKKENGNSGVNGIDKEKALKLYEKYKELLKYREVDTKKLKGKELEEHNSKLQELKTLELNIEFIKYYAGLESSYEPRDGKKTFNDWNDDTLKQEIYNKKRIKQTAEIFTPKNIVNDMLNQLPIELFTNMDSTFLEPAAGHGNFVEEILRRKFKYAKNYEDKIRALKSVYAIELMFDNVEDMKNRIKLLLEEYGVTNNEDIDYILNRNIQQGNFLTKENMFGEDISFHDWNTGKDTTLKEMLNNKKDDTLNQDLYDEQMELAEENARLDEIYPEYKGETININGKERSVYNSNGERIAKSEQALRNFYAWFGDSKVVDSQGRPLVVYHGTDAEFDTFDQTKVGKHAAKLGGGFYTTDVKREAGGYGKPMALYVSIQKPIQITNHSENISAEQRQKLYDYLKTYLGVSKFRDNLTSDDEIFLHDLYFDLDYKVRYEKFHEALKKVLGADGIINTLKQNGGQEFVVPTSNQIKSVDNKGTFNLEDNNIYNQDLYTYIFFQETYNQKALGGAVDLFLKQIFSKKQDTATLLHEFAHIMLQINYQHYLSGKATPEFRAEFKKLLNELDVTEEQLYYRQPLTREQQEKYAHQYIRWLYIGTNIDNSVFTSLQKMLKITYDNIDMIGGKKTINPSEEMESWFRYMSGITLKENGEQLLKNGEIPNQTIEQKEQSVQNIEQLNSAVEPITNKNIKNIKKENEERKEKVEIEARESEVLGNDESVIKDKLQKETDELKEKIKELSNKPNNTKQIEDLELQLKETEETLNNFDETETKQIETKTETTEEIELKDVAGNTVSRQFITVAGKSYKVIEFANKLVDEDTETAYLIATEQIENPYGDNILTPLRAILMNKYKNTEFNDRYLELLRDFSNTMSRSGQDLYFANATGNTKGNNLLLNALYRLRKALQLQVELKTRTEITKLNEYIISKLQTFNYEEFSKLKKPQREKVIKEFLSGFLEERGIKLDDALFQEIYEDYKNEQKDKTLIAVRKLKAMIQQGEQDIKRIKKYIYFSDESVIEKIKDLHKKNELKGKTEEDLLDMFGIDIAKINGSQLHSMIDKLLGLELTNKNYQSYIEKAKEIEKKYNFTEEQLRGELTEEIINRELELNDLINSSIPITIGEFFSTTRRGNLIFQLGTATTNIAGNTVSTAGNLTWLGAYNIINKITNKNSFVKKGVILKKIIHNMRIYRKTGILPCNINTGSSIDGFALFGENLKKTSSFITQRYNNLLTRNLERAYNFVYNTLIFKYLMGWHDAFTKACMFEIYAAKFTNEFINQDIKNGLITKEEATKKAEEMFLDIQNVVPNYDRTGAIKSLCYTFANRATFTDKNKFTDAINNIRNWIDKQTKELKLGTNTVPFSTTLVNMNLFALRCTLPIKELYNLYTWTAGKNKHLTKIEQMEQNYETLRVLSGSLGMIGLIALIKSYSSDDDDEYLPTYSLSNNKERELQRLTGRPYNSIKLKNGVYFPIEWLGPDFVGISAYLYAEKQAKEKKESKLDNFIGVTLGLSIVDMPLLNINIADTIEKITKDTKGVITEMASDMVSTMIPIAGGRQIIQIEEEISGIKYNKNNKFGKALKDNALTNWMLEERYNPFTGDSDEPKKWKLLFGARGGTLERNDDPYVKGLIKLVKTDNMPFNNPFYGTTNLAKFIKELNSKGKQVNVNELARERGLLYRKYAEPIVLSKIDSKVKLKKLNKIKLNVDKIILNNLENKYKIKFKSKK